MSIVWNCDRAAAVVTVNLDAEQFWLGMFPDSQRRPKTLSMGDYGIARGLDRVLRALSDYEIRATFFVPGMIALRHPEAVEKIIAAGHEIALHGHTHTPLHLLGRDAQAEELSLGREAIRSVAGRDPAGFRAPEGELTAESLRLVREAGFVYSSSLYDDDRPYLHEAIGLIELPMNWNLHDFPYFAFNYGPAFPIAQSRVSSYQRVEENYLEELDAYAAAGLLYVPQFTPQSIGSPGRIPIMRHVLEAMRSRGGLLICTCGELVGRLLEDRTASGAAPQAGRADG